MSPALLGSSTRPATSPHTALAPSSPPFRSCAARGGERVEVEPVHAGSIATHHRLHLDRIDVAECQAQMFVAERPAAFLVGIVAAPHDLVDADDVAQSDLGLADEARADVTLPRPVL